MSQKILERRRLSVNPLQDATVRFERVEAARPKIKSAGVARNEPDGFAHVLVLDSLPFDGPRLEADEPPDKVTRLPAVGVPSSILSPPLPFGSGTSGRRNRPSRKLFAFACDAPVTKFPRNVETGAILGAGELRSTLMVRLKAETVFGLFSRRAPAPFTVRVGQQV